MKRIFVSIIFLFLTCVFGTSQEGKKLIDIVNEIKAEQNGKSLKKTTSARTAEESLVESETSRKAKEPSRKETPKAKQVPHSPNSYELIIRLLEGNARFISGHIAEKDFTHQRAELTKGQHPFAIILCCSDSRVPPELLFDESLGQLFVVRIAGNVVDSAVLGSIEYAAEHLHAPLLIVLGHESCGAVAATIQGGSVPPNIASLVKRIKPAVAHVKTEHSHSLKDGQLTNECVEENVREQMKQSLLQSDMLKEMSEQSELAIVGAVYSLESGTVRFLSTKQSDPESVENNIDTDGKGH